MNTSFQVHQTHAYWLLTASVTPLCCAATSAERAHRSVAAAYTLFACCLPRYTLTNEQSQMRLEVLNYGATIVSLKVPDKHGKLVDVVLAYTDTEGA